MRRLEFLGRSLVRGVTWLGRVLGVMGSILFLGTLVAGVTISVVLLDAPAWVVVVVGCLAILCAFGEGAYREWDAATRERLPVGLSSPNPLTVLTWNGQDYEPSAAKLHPGPKLFIGSVDPGTVRGIAVNEYDSWHVA